MRIAIVVTCFNDGSTLSEAVESITSGAEGVELVVVDDGSSDQPTLQVLDGMRDDGVSVIRQENAGLSAAATVGLRATTAPYVMRFDSDDLLEPGAVEALADALDAQPDAVAALGDVKTFGLTTFSIRGVPALDAWLVTYTNCLTGSGTLFRRSALDDVGSWQLREGFEDWDVWMSLAERGSVGVYVPRTIFRYRRDRSGTLRGWLDETESHYGELRRRHEILFSMRPVTRRSSSVPYALKIALPLIDRLPWLSRLTKIHLSELLARLLWSAGLRATLPMVFQAARYRLMQR